LYYIRSDGIEERDWTGFRVELGGYGSSHEDTTAPETKRYSHDHTSLYQAAKKSY